MKKHNYDDLGCRNCKTKRHPEYRSGYCNRCHYRVRKLSALERGAWKSRTKSKRARDNSEYLIYQTEKKLRIFRELEAPFTEDYIDPLRLEGLLHSLVNATHSYIPNFPTGFSTVLFNEIPPSENLPVYRTLYGVLLSIVENLPVRKYRRDSSSLWFWPSHSAEAYSEYEDFCEWKKQRAQ